MPQFIEFLSDDGSVILVELETNNVGITRSSKEDKKIVQTGKSFTEAFASIRASVHALMKEVDALHVEEGEIKFGLKALAEAGVFAVGKVGGEINYEITLRWKKPEQN